MIIRNCPANCDIPEGHTDNEGNFIIEGWEERNWCEYFRTNCENVSECLIKKIYKDYNITEFEIWGKNNA